MKVKCSVCEEQYDESWYSYWEAKILNLRRIFLMKSVPKEIRTEKNMVLNIIRTLNWKEKHTNHDKKELNLNGVIGEIKE